MNEYNNCNFASAYSMIALSFKKTQFEKCYVNKTNEGFKCGV